VTNTKEKTNNIHTKLTMVQNLRSPLFSQFESVKRPHALYLSKKLSKRVISDLDPDINMSKCYLSSIQRPGVIFLCAYLFENSQK
jgi:hypothetical protein